MRRYLNSLIPAVVVALAAVAVGGCGGDDDGDGSVGATAADTGTTATPGVVTVSMGDYFFDPKDVAAKAGSVAISAPNVGQVEHELVLFKTDDNPASLPVSGGEVDEAALEGQGAENVGEIEEVLPGQTKEATIKLTPGRYVMFCNLPNHYAQGMYGSFTVK